MDLPVDRYPPPGTLDDVLGFELLDVSAEGCRARFATEKRVQQPMGLVHGGAYAAMAESMVSIATWVGIQADGSVPLGQSNNSSFLRPPRGAFVHAEGRPIHRGRSSWVWDVAFTDDEERLCAISRVTIAVRPAQT